MCMFIGEGGVYGDLGRECLVIWGVGGSAC